MMANTFLRQPLISLLLLGFFVGILGILILSNSTQVLENIPRNTSTAAKIIKPSVSPSPTPIPFAEITIPYLRSRNYPSSLGQLEKVQENLDYTGYITSYNSDDFKIYGLLTIPKGDKPPNGWPAVIFVHGYIPPQQYRTLEKYVSYVDYLARNGFVVFKIDLRGHGRSEGEAGGGYYGSDYVVDTLSAYTALASSEFVDPKAIGLWGHSMAGNTVLRAMAAKPEIPAGVIWAGAVYTYIDMQIYGLNDNSYRPPSTDSPKRRRQQEMFSLYGRPAEGNPFWQQVAPTNYLNDLQGALQIHHANNDTVVDIRYSTNLVKLLEQTQVSHELITHTSGGHDIEGSSFSIAMQRTVKFYKKHLSN